MFSGYQSLNTYNFQYFLLLSTLSFHFFNSISAVSKFLILMQSNLSIFFLYSLCFGCHVQKKLLPSHKNGSCFLLGVLQFQLLHLVYNQFTIAAKTNHHKPVPFITALNIVSLKWISLCCKQGVGRPVSLLEALGEDVSLLFSATKGPDIVAHDLFSPSLKTTTSD